MSSKTIKRKNQRLTRKAKAMSLIGRAFPGVPAAVKNNTGALLRCIVRASQNDANSSGTGGQGYSFLLNYPTYFRAPGGSFSQCGNVASSFANEVKTFDEYRVLGMRVMYSPNFQSHSDATSTVSIDPTLLSLQDFDDSALLTSIGKALNAQDPSYGIQTVWGQKPFMLQNMRQVDPFDELKWLNTQNSNPSSPDAIVPASQSAVKIWRNGYGAINQIVGVYTIEWDVVFRGIYSGQ